MNKLLIILPLMALVFQSCKTTEQSGETPKVPEVKSDIATGYQSNTEVIDITSRIVVPSELPQEKNEDSGSEDLKSRIVVPSEISVVQNEKEQGEDLKSRIVVPSEIEPEEESLKSKIFIPSEAM